MTIREFVTLVIGALVIVLLATTLAFSHSWYPRECCSERDCQQIASEEVRVLPQGGYQWRDHTIPQGKVRFSPDDHYHICIFSGRVLCFFAPQPSM